MNLNTIYIEKERKVIVPESDYRISANLTEIASICRNLETFGFRLEPEVIKALTVIPLKELEQWYKEVVADCKELVGAHREYNPMYPNFPEQVMKTSDAQLYINAMMHYLGFVLADIVYDPSYTIMPEFDKEERFPINESEFKALIPLSLGTHKDCLAIFTRLVGANGSISESDKQIVKGFWEDYREELVMPTAIPNKENMAYLASLMDDAEDTKSFLKTATDVLRLACAMSDGDVSLAKSTRFRNFTRKERRMLLGSLENIQNPLEDMARWKKRWIRLGERLHPSEYASRFPKTAKAFKKLRENAKIETFNSSMESLLKKGSSGKLAELASKRPGDFARRLDHILRTVKQPNRVVNAFKEVASKVSTPVLIQVMKHFEVRDSLEYRSVYPKGIVAKVQLLEGKLPEIKKGISEKVVKAIQEVLVTRFADKEDLGKCYLDEGLKDILMPFSQRSASRALYTVPRGSKFPLDDGKVVRFFCWWKQPKEMREDIDLSATLLDENFKVTKNIFYGDLKADFGCHSGDITSAPNGASEFIDLDLEKVREEGHRYIVMSVLSYTRNNFVDLDECFAGWMLRDAVQSGEVYEPRTVQNKVDLTSEDTSNIPLIIDVEEGMVYWADLGVKNTHNLFHNVVSNKAGIKEIAKSIIHTQKPTVYDLLKLHIEARGELVEDKEEADNVFSVFDGDVTAFDTDTLLSEYLEN